MRIPSVRPRFVALFLALLLTLTWCGAVMAQGDPVATMVSTTLASPLGVTWPVAFVLGCWIASRELSRHQAEQAKRRQEMVELVLREMRACLIEAVNQITRESRLWRRCVDSEPTGSHQLPEQ